MDKAGVSTMENHVEAQVRLRDAEAERSFATAREFVEAWRKAGEGEGGSPKGEPE